MVFRFVLVAILLAATAGRAQRENPALSADENRLRSTFAGAVPSIAVFASDRDGGILFTRAGPYGELMFNTIPQVGAISPFAVISTPLDPFIDPLHGYGEPVVLPAFLNSCAIYLLTVYPNEASFDDVKAALEVAIADLAYAASRGKDADDNLITTYRFGSVTFCALADPPDKGSAGHLRVCMPMPGATANGQVPVFPSTTIHDITNARIKELQTLRDEAFDPAAPPPIDESYLRSVFGAAIPHLSLFGAVDARNMYIRAFPETVNEYYLRVTVSRDRKGRRATVSMKLAPWIDPSYRQSDPVFSQDYYNSCATYLSQTYPGVLTLDRALAAVHAAVTEVVYQVRSSKDGDADVSRIFNIDGVRFAVHSDRRTEQAGYIMVHMPVIHPKLKGSFDSADPTTIVDLSPLIKQGSYAARPQSPAP